MIKFRAWDKRRKEMWKVATLHIEDEYADLFKTNIYEKPFYNPWAKFEDLILMQSTGLKDKNGVEIFEGDVVRYTWDMLSDVNATEKGKKVRISKVFWSDWRASWAVGKKSCNNDLFRYARNGNTVEVIGNIYTNPELLSSGIE